MDLYSITFYGAIFISGAAITIAIGWCCMSSTSVSVKEMTADIKEKSQAISEENDETKRFIQTTKNEFAAVSQTLKDSNLQSVKTTAVLKKQNEETEHLLYEIKEGKTSYLKTFEESEQLTQKAKDATKQFEEFLHQRKQTSEKPPSTLQY